MLPYFAGERTPLFDSRARGVVAGLDLSHTSANLFRAALEGIAFAVRHNLDVMREAGSRPRRFVASRRRAQRGALAADSERRHRP